MTTLKSILVISIVAFLSFTEYTGASSFSLRPRMYRRGKADIVKELLQAIGVFTEDKSVNAWDFRKLPDMCEVFMETENGGNCWAVVDCQEGGRIEYNNNHDTWNVCYVGGRQYFTDPRIGEFSITFTKKDGNEGEGLTDPVLQVKHVDNWREIDVSGLSSAEEQADGCEAGLAPIDCHQGPWICHFAHYGDSNESIFGSRKKRWQCGVPKQGAKFPEDLNWEAVWG